MKITLEHLGDTYSIEKKTDITATEVLETFTNLMLSAGWQRGSVDSAIMALNEEIDL